MVLIWRSDPENGWFWPFTEPAVQEGSAQASLFNVAYKESTPFAVIGSNTVVEARGQRVRGRLYPWGIVEVENPSHCDFVKLRNMLIRTHMHDLKDITCDVHYENYRAQCIQQMTSKMTQDNRVESPIPILPLSTPDVETEKLIKMKDEELRRMQEMLQKMQQQMHEQDL
ncbi:hypothetical protein AALO_G00164880 [Alosa alosa]|uniref:Septin-type G domain-containing protein n=1 Tax=Alosa alosa TaxID=278164 RepID=A0AAV6GCW4_9TELE|nr:hypothetical protein AALO_G00164880 [Alosa alosa]